MIMMNNNSWLVSAHTQRKYENMSMSLKMQCVISALLVAPNGIAICLLKQYDSGVSCGQGCQTMYSIETCKKEVTIFAILIGVRSDFKQQIIR